MLVGTPGRVLDHLSKTGPNVLNLSKLEYVVLDEVDRMLDMGFAEDVEKILSSGTMCAVAVCLYSLVTVARSALRVLVHRP